MRSDSYNFYDLDFKDGKLEWAFRRTSCGQHRVACNTPLLSFEDNLRNQALLKAMSKVGASDLDLGVELGELKETIQFLRSPFQGLRTLLYNPKHVNNIIKMCAWEKGKGVRKYLTKRLLSNMSDTWLETRYALLPLLRSIQQIAQQCEEGYSKVELGRIYTARSKVVGDLELTGKVTTGSSSCYIDCPWVVKHKTTARAFVHYKFDAIPTWNQMLGLSPEYIPEVMWNLTSLSFVWDWAFNIGHIFGALRFNPNITILGNCVGARTEIDGMTTPSQRDQSWKGVLLPGTVSGDRYIRKTNVIPSYVPSLKASVNLSVPQLVDLTLFLKSRLRQK